MAKTRVRASWVRGAQVLAGTAGVLALAACGVVPSYPAPLDTDYVPSLGATPTVGMGALSPDGFSQAQRMTVRVRNIGCSGLSTGTGFAIDPNTLVTNRHVVENSRDLEITTYDGHTIDVTAADVTTLADLAIVTTDQPIGASSILAGGDPVEGDEITVIGYPLGGQLTTTSGVVIGPVEDPLEASTGSVLASTASVQPGSSGSPVLNEAGEVVGVIYAKDDAELSYLIPVSVLRNLIDEDGLLVPEPSECPSPS